MDYQTERYRDLDVCWTPELDGGGRVFVPEYLAIVRSLFGRVGRVFEFCAGPGFIGWSLLAHGLCDSLVLADVNPDAVEALRETARRNDLGDRVRVYKSDGLAGIPEDERWDLVVGNPPHFAEPYVRVDRSLITDDVGWRLHEAFYGAVGRFLADGGSVLLLENSMASSPADFVPMLQAGGLECVRTLWYPANGQSCFYYLWSRKALDGLILEPSTIDVHEVELTEPSSTTTIGNAGVLRLHLRNRLDRVVRPRLIAASWQDVLDPIPPHGTRSLPSLALAAGTYVIDDDSGNGANVELAIIKVPAR
jgi:hypothetical protein